MNNPQIYLKTKTNLCKVFNIYVHKYYMHSDLSEQQKGDVFFLQFHYSKKGLEHSVFEEYAEEIFNYIVNSLDNDANFGEIITQSKQHLGYAISDHSFSTFFRSLLANPKTTTSAQNIILLQDNLGLFNHETFNLSQDYYAIYRNIIVESSPINSRSSTPESDINPQTSSDNFISLDDKKVQPFTEDSALFNNGDNNVILLYTIITFVSILTLAWVVRKYYPETLVKDDSKLDNASESLHSVHENIILFNKCFFNLALLFLPSILITLYLFRYFYYYRLHNYISNILK